MAKARRDRKQKYLLGIKTRFYGSLWNRFTPARLRFNDKCERVMAMNAVKSIEREGPSCETWFRLGLLIANARRADLAGGPR